MGCADWCANAEGGMSSERMAPGDEFAVVTLAGTDGSYHGTPAGDEPFHLRHAANKVTVWANGAISWVEDHDGNEIDCGHQRPDDYYPSRPSAEEQEAALDEALQLLPPLDLTPRRRSLPRWITWPNRK